MLENVSTKFIKKSTVYITMSEMFKNINLSNFLFYFQINYQCFYKQWHDQAAQPQKMTFFNRGRDQKSLLI